MSLLSVDIGGTSIKYALYSKGSLSNKGNFLTPLTIEEFYRKLIEIVEYFKARFNVNGVAISSPGAVNKDTGVIEGNSAIPYIHNFDICSILEEKFKLKVAIENDANCAALAEMEYGVSKGLKTVLFFVLGTGVGGSVVINGEIHHGKHLFGGEFGYMLMDKKNSLSSIGTTVSMERRYSEIDGEKTDAVTISERAFKGEKLAKKELDIFTYNIARAIFNLTYSLDPDLIVIGGGVSQAEWLIPELEKQFKRIMKIINCPFMPKVVPCKYKNDANLIGAGVNFISKNYKNYLEYV